MENPNSTDKYRSSYAAWKLFGALCQLEAEFPGSRVKKKDVGL